MTRDFKQSEATASSSQYGISWVLGGVAVGLLAGAVVYALMSQQGSNLLNLASGGSAQNTPQTPQQNTTGTVATTQQPTLQDKPKTDERPGFSYHAVLPQLELDVLPISTPKETAPPNNQDIPRVTAAEQVAVQQQQQAASAGRYMFQLGAYRNRAQAEQMQRRARQNGMNTRVEPAKINGQTWYRVRLGPTDNIQIVNRWKQRLSSMGINPMMIRL